MESIRALLDAINASQQYDLVALVIFATVLIFLALRLRSRIRTGLGFLESLEAKADEIAKAVKDNATAATLVRSGSSTENALTVPKSSYDLGDLLSPSKKTHKEALRQPMSELREGLLGYSDNLTLANPLETGTPRFVAFQRVSDAFSAQLPERFVAAGRAMTFSRLAVQSGLAFSVLFILVALVSEDPADILRNIRYKFGFTVLGLAASLLVQWMVGNASTKGRLAFLRFEDALIQKLSADVMSPLAGSYQLLQDQRMLKDELKSTLLAFSEQIGSLKASAGSLANAAEAAAETLSGVMTVTSASSERITGEVEAHITKMISDVEAAQNSFREQVESSASAVIGRYGEALESAGENFKSVTGVAGAGFRESVTAAGDRFSEDVGSASRKAASEIGTTSETLSASAQRAANVLSASYNRATEEFERQFDTASRRYLASVGKIGETTAEIANIQASVLNKMNDEVASAGRRIRDLTEEEIRMLRTEIEVQKQKIREELETKEVIVQRPLDAVDVREPDRREPDVDGLEEPDFAATSRENRGDIAPNTEQEPQQDSPKNSEPKKDLEG